MLEIGRSSRRNLGPLRSALRASARPFIWVLGGQDDPKTFGDTVCLDATVRL